MVVSASEETTSTSPQSLSFCRNNSSQNQSVSAWRNKLYHTYIPYIHEPASLLVVDICRVYTAVAGELKQYNTAFTAAVCSTPTHVRRILLLNIDAL